MNELQIFSNSEFGEVRTVQLNNEIYFVGKDVAAALGYLDTVSALKQHVSEEDKVMGCQNTTPYIIDSMGRKQYPTFINESGLYALIFGSKLESAKRFKHWVTSEVLPSIRKTGIYQFETLSTEMKAILMHDEKIVKIESRMNKLEFDIPLFGAESDELSSHVKRKGVEILGGKQSEAYKDSKVRQAVYTDIYNQIKREYGLYDESGKYKSYKALKRKYIETAHKLIDAYIPPTYLAELIVVCNAQMRMEAV